MAENFGLNFSPMAGSGQKPMQRPTGGGGVQDAIRTLSLKIPKVSGAQGIAPGPLLQSPGGGGAPAGTEQQPSYGDDVLQAILRALGLVPNGAPTAGLGGAAPVPRVIPGAGGSQQPGDMPPLVGGGGPVWNGPKGTPGQGVGIPGGIDRSRIRTTGAPMGGGMNFTDLLNQGGQGPMGG